MTALDFINAAHRLIGAMGLPGRTLSPEQQTEGLAFLQNLFEHYSTVRSMTYTVNDSGALALTSGTQFYWIGPGATPNTVGGVPYGAFNTYRPNQILEARLIYQTSPSITRLGVHNLNYQQWANILTPQIFAIPMELYYDHQYSQGAPAPTTGLGLIALWPGPQAAYELQLWTTQPLVSSTLATGTTLLFPPSYARTFQLLLARDMAILYPELPNQASSRLEVRAEEAKRDMESFNVPDGLTYIDASFGGNQGISDFNWLVSLG